MTREWVLERLSKGHCEVTRLPFMFDRTTTNSNPLAPSIDQINPGKGYYPENCQMVVTIYNQAKADYGEGAVLAMARALLRNTQGENL